MKLKNLSILEFDKYAESHPLGSYHQSSCYALLASESGYERVRLFDRYRRRSFQGLYFTERNYFLQQYF